MPNCWLVVIEVLAAKVELVDAPGLGDRVYGLLDVGKRVQDLDLYPVAMRGLLHDRLMAEVGALEVVPINELESFRTELSL